MRGHSLFARLTVMPRLDRHVDLGLLRNLVLGRNIVAHKCINQQEPAGIRVAVDHDFGVTECESQATSGPRLIRSHVQA